MTRCSTRSFAEHPRPAARAAEGERQHARRSIRTAARPTSTSMAMASRRSATRCGEQDQRPEEGRRPASTATAPRSLTACSTVSVPSMRPRAPRRSTQCGKPRFVDGISVELNFATTRVKSLQPAPCDRDRDVVTGPLILAVGVAAPPRDARARRRRDRGGPGGHRRDAASRRAAGRVRRADRRRQGARGRAPTRPPRARRRHHGDDRRRDPRQGRRRPRRPRRCCAAWPTARTR